MKGIGFLTKRERNVSSYNSNPCDLAAGEEETFRMIGFEVKSDGDSYTRLTGQLDAYLFAFDEVYLVVHKKKIPEWLPREIGVLRVFNNGDIVREKNPWTKDPFDISSNFEWEGLFKANNLGKYSSKTKDFLGALMGIRKNIVFNRFFGEYEWMNKVPTKFFPFSEKEKFILDATCGGRMMWFNKNHPNTLYVDRRKTTLKETFLNKVYLNIINMRRKSTLQKLKTKRYANVLRDLEMWTCYDLFGTGKYELEDKKVYWKKILLEDVKNNKIRLEDFRYLMQCFLLPFWDKLKEEMNKEELKELKAWRNLLEELK